MKDINGKTIEVGNKVAFSVMFGEQVIGFPSEKW